METKQIGLLGVIVAMSLAFVAIGVSATPLLIAEPISTQSSGWISGHVTTTVYDDDGNIKHYFQSDNAVLDNGEDCAIEALFDSDGTGNCNVALGATGFNFIAIGTGAQAVAVTQTGLQGTESARTQDADCTFIAAAGGAQAGQCLLSATFTELSTTIEESAVYDAAGGANAFARQLTGTISLATADTLQVDWTFTIDGSSNP